MRDLPERSYWLGFSLFPGVGPGRLSSLLAAFGSAKAAWQASFMALRESGIPIRLIHEFVDFRKKCELEAYEALLQQKHISYTTSAEETYPFLLRQIKNPPIVLFCNGDPDVEDALPVGVVGTRKVTEYGREITKNMTADLVRAGCTIISGLALGVDAIAHETTLAARGKTIAVLGCGIDCCSPRENALLYNSIVEKGGCIVSEYGLGVSPTKGSFPSRNRIIAGLSLGVLVTEGAEDSGALITAHDAWVSKRKVFAVPGPITSTLSQGPYQLLKQGATLVKSATEILDELGVKQQKKLRKKVVGDTQEEQAIIDLLQQENLPIDELVKQSGQSTASLGIMLSLMEMKGFIKRLDAGFFSLNNDN